MTPDNKFKSNNKTKMSGFIEYVKNPVHFSIIIFTVLIIFTVVTAFVFKSKTIKLTQAVNDKIVIINVDNKTLTIPSKEPTVGALLKKLDIKINPGDVVEPSQSTGIYQDDFRINIYRAMPAEIIENGVSKFVFSAATTPRSIAQQQGVTVYPADVVSDTPVQNFIQSYAIGRQIVITPATPVYVNLYGTSLLIRTQTKTVGDLIKQEDIHLSLSDQIIPSENTTITPYSQVFIIRRGVKIESVTQTIAMPVQVISDPTLAYGTGAVRQYGSPGTEVITYQDNTENGIVVSRTILQDVITVQPVTQIEVEGTSLSGIKGDMALAGIATSDYAYADYIISHESGWCPTKAQGEHYCPVTPDNAMTPNGYGLCQATPGYKMASAGADWQTNPVTQLRWCSSYASARYGGWYNAYVHWLNYHNW